MLKHGQNGPGSELNTSFFSLSDQTSNRTVPSSQTVILREKHSIDSSKPTAYPKSKHGPSRRFFSGQAFARSNKRKSVRNFTFSPCSAAENEKSSDESVVVIGRNASFDRSLLENPSTLTGRLTNKVRSRYKRRGSGTSHKASKINRNRPHMPLACYSAENNGAIDQNDVEDFMLDLDEAWHPNGYSLEDHTDFLIEMNKTSGGPGQVTVVCQIDDRRPVDRIQRVPAPLEMVVQEVESPFLVENEEVEEYLSMTASEKTSSKGGVVEANLGQVAVDGEPRFDTARFTTKPKEDTSGTSSPASVSLSFPCHKRRRSREFGSESIKFVRPDEGLDLSEVYIHLGSVNEIGEKFKAKSTSGIIRKENSSLPRSLSSASIPSQRTIPNTSNKNYGRTRSAVHIATLEASSPEESGWFKLARPRHQSWADFSQSFSEEKGSTPWKRYNQANNLPLPEPSFAGVGTLGTRFKSSSSSSSEDPCASIEVSRSHSIFNTEGVASPDENQPASPPHQGQLDRSLSEEHDGGALPVPRDGSRQLGLVTKGSDRLDSHPFSQARSHYHLNSYVAPQSSHEKQIARGSHPFCIPGHSKSGDRTRC